MVGVREGFFISFNWVGSLDVVLEGVGAVIGCLEFRTFYIFLTVVFGCCIRLIFFGKFSV